MFDAQKEPDGGSHRSGSEGSPEGAASTLLAPAPREQDQEEASRTLVLVSAGNGAISPLDGQGTLGAVTPQAPDESERGALAFVLRQGAAATVGRSSSPPLAKVERTFMHIEEKTHRIVMTAGKQPQQEEREDEREERKDESAGEERGSSKEEIIWEKPPEGWAAVEELGEEGEKEEDRQEESADEECSRVEKAKKEDRNEEKEACSPAEKEVEQEVLGERLEQRRPSTARQEETQSTEIKTEGKTGPAERHREEATAPIVINDVETEVKRKYEVASRSPQAIPRRCSRIPVLISEEETGSDRSSQTSPNQSHRLRKSRRPQLARLVLERKRSTQSTTASEDDTHQSDDSARARGDEGSARSRIPRPVTPVKKASIKSGSATTPRTQRSVSFVQASSVSFGIQKSASAHSNIHQQKPRPLLYPSKTLPPRTAATGPCPSSTARTALRSAARPATPFLRNASTSPRGNSRTDSPSPQRLLHSERRPLAVTLSKSKPQDSAQKKCKGTQAAVPPRGKREASDSKSKSR